MKVQLRMPRQDRFWDLAHPMQECMHLVEARCFVDVFDQEGRPVKLLRCTVPQWVPCEVDAIRGRGPLAR